MSSVLSNQLMVFVDRSICECKLELILSYKH